MNITIEIKGYKNLMNYLAKYGIKECILEIEESEVFGSKVLVTRVGKFTYIEIPKRKIIVYDLTIQECKKITEFLEVTKINRSFTVLDQNDKCVYMKSCK